MTNKPTYANDMKGKTGIRRIINAFGYSMDGLKAAYKSEAAFRQVAWLNGVLVVLIVCLPFAIALKMLLLLTSALSIIVELFNTGLEAVVDRIGSDYHQSKQFLETHLQQPIEHFCYPYGHFKPQHVEMLKQAGFISSTAMYRGRVKVPSSGLNLDERLTLARVTVNNNCYPHIFLMKLLTGYEDKKGLKLLQK